MVLERNPDYYETGKPYVDGIEMTIASDDTSRTAAVKTGTVDFIEYAPLKDIPSLKSDTSLMMAGDQNTNIRFVGLNVTRKPFSDLKVRQAIAMAVDRDAVLGPAVFGFGTPTLEIFPPGYWAGLGTKPGRRRHCQSQANAGGCRLPERLRHHHFELVAILVPVERGGRLPGAAQTDRHQCRRQPRGKCGVHQGLSRQ